MRCFIAVPMSAAITEMVASALPRLQAEAERSGLKVSWARPDGWHVTVKFLGEIDDAKIEPIGGALAAIAAVARRFDVEATGLMTLPDGARTPSVLAVSLSDDGRFTELARKVDERLAGEGFERERRGFRPHLTVGRIRSPRGWRTFERAIAPLALRSFGHGEVRTMTLYRSWLGDGPARYDALASFELGCA